MCSCMELKNEVAIGIQVIKVVKQEMNDGVAAQLSGKIPTLALNKILL